jgi:putative N-acetyltransferase (TIGR04045 family)
VRTASPSRSAILCRAVADEAELAAHLELRRRVFVAEQGLFSEDDLDERDADPRTVHVVGLVGDEVCGAVRLYPLDDRDWKGDRLAVARDRRTLHLGAALVRCAVRTAGELGGSRMLAHIQLPNVAFFELLGWTVSGLPAPFHGVEHQLMTIPLRRE